MNCVMFSVNFAVCSVQCKAYRVQCVLGSVQNTVCSVQCAAYSVQGTVCSVQGISGKSAMLIGGAYGGTQREPDTLSTALWTLLYSVVLCCALGAVCCVVHFTVQQYVRCHLRLVSKKRII